MILSVFLLALACSVLASTDAQSPTFDRQDRDYRPLQPTPAYELNAWARKAGSTILSALYPSQDKYDNFKRLRKEVQWLYIVPDFSSWHPPSTGSTFGKRDMYRPLQFGKREYRPLQFGKRTSLGSTSYLVPPL
ncbi:unnamed protein product [Angiostrongylus costaricensis]|uniref:Neuropeptide-Like Protein n=1 Tax=Angiostrongylus costaricensis TaxID=334426 RepID=A0A0R3PL64_ANGCS|nr:unnamed protein product [Angiostrongylus costaricensis]